MVIGQEIKMKYILEQLMLFADLAKVPYEKKAIIGKYV